VASQPDGKLRITFSLRADNGGSPGLK
jgi:hypothetical protein